MGDGGRIPKPGLGEVERVQRQSAEVPIPSRSLDGRDPMQPITDPMRHVRAEKAEAAASVDRSLKAWRSAKPAAAALPSTERVPGAWRAQMTPAPYPYKIPVGGGASVSGDVRARLEPALGADLSGAKVHTGADSAKAADKLGARAFTIGQDVHFGAGEYQPGSKEGDRLIAHEMTHTVQAKSSGIQRKAGTPVNEDAGLEHEADAMGAKAAGGAHEVSQPHEPAEKEADAAADHAVDKLHGDGKDAAHGAGAAQGDKSEKRAAKEAAPPIGAKLVEGAIFRMPKVGADHDEDAEGQKSGGKDRRKPGSLGQSKGTDALRQENKVVRDVVVELKLDKDQARKLHDVISGQGLDYHGIKAMAQSMFPNGGKAK
jgi:hypothetical protein